jgi:hypothetical protein
VEWSANAIVRVESVTETPRAWGVRAPTAGCVRIDGR